MKQQVELQQQVELCVLETTAHLYKYVHLVAHGTRNESNASCDTFDAGVQARRRPLTIEIIRKI